MVEGRVEIDEGAIEAMRRGDETLAYRAVEAVERR
jgi:hypothetical protein